MSDQRLRTTEYRLNVCKGTYSKNVSKGSYSKVVIVNCQLHSIRCWRSAGRRRIGRPTSVENRPEPTASVALQFAAANNQGARKERFNGQKQRRYISRWICSNDDSKDRYRQRVHDRARRRGSPLLAAQRSACNYHMRPAE